MNLLKLTPPFKNYSISSPFGMRYDPILKDENGNPLWKLHPGVDIVPVGNMNIRAGHDGEIVIKKYEENGFGHFLVEHFKLSGSPYFIFYTHMLEETTFEVGDRIKAGQHVGICGKSGRATGIHICYRICKDSAKKEDYKKCAFDPTPYFV